MWKVYYNHRSYFNFLMQDKPKKSDIIFDEYKDNNDQPDVEFPLIEKEKESEWLMYSPL